MATNMSPIIGIANSTLDKRCDVLRKFLNDIESRLADNCGFVAEIDGAIGGYAYAATYRARPAYGYTVEDSVYIDQAYAGKGIGSALMPGLIDGCERAGRRQIIAVIGDSANLASIRLHKKFGFTRVGMLPAVGFKFGRWVDSVLMQRDVGGGQSLPPT